MLAGRDLMAGAQTGTGKTAAFALPILQRLAPLASTSASPARHPVRALVLTPTRELAVQVAESVRDYGKHLPLRSTVVYGGVDMNAQIEQLRKGVEILVATPGPSARPRAEQDGDVQPGLGPGAGRSRPHARHGLPARHQAHHRAAAARSARTCCSPRRSRTRSAALVKTHAAQPGRGADRGAQRRRRPRHATCMHPVAREKKRELLSLPDPDPRTEAGAGVHRHAHRRQPPRAPAARATTSRPTRSTATSRRPSARPRSPTSRRARPPCWWRPTSPRAASTSRGCRR